MTANESASSQNARSTESIKKEHDENLENKGSNEYNTPYRLFAQQLLLRKQKADEAAADQKLGKRKADGMRASDGSSSPSTNRDLGEAMHPTISRAIACRVCPAQHRSTATSRCGRPHFMTLYVERCDFPAGLDPFVKSDEKILRDFAREWAAERRDKMNQEDLIAMYGCD